MRSAALETGSFGLVPGWSRAYGFPQAVSPMARANPTPTPVILACTSPRDADFIESMIEGDGSRQFIVAVRALEADEVIRALEAGMADLAVVDPAVAPGREIEFVSNVCNAFSPAPVIVLTEAENDELAIAAVQAGAQDCLSRAHLSPALLLQAMRYAKERVRVEMALAKEHDLLHALLDSIPDRIYFKDDRSRFLRVSAELAKFFGIERPEDAVGRTDFDFFTDEHARPAFEDEQHVMKTGNAIVGKIEKETLPDGRIGWAHTTKLPLRDRHGRIIGTCGISRDITDLKKLEDALAAERNLLRNVIDHLPDPIYVKDRDGTFRVSNAAYAERLGLAAPEDVVGQTSQNLRPREPAYLFDEAEGEVFQAGQPQLNREEQLVLADGSVRWLMSSRVPLRVAKGETLSIACIGRDNTEEKQARQELEEANANLFKALADLRRADSELRSVQLQLIEAEKMKSIGRLAAGVAHEVKNPLATISMGLEFLRHRVSDEPAVDGVIADLQEAVMRADSVIKGLLDFSAPNRLELNAYDLNQIIEHALVLVRGEAREGSLQIVREFGEIPPVQLDRLKIEQVLINILTNAIHAMNRSGTLTVRTRSEQITRVGPNISGSRSERFRAGERVVIAEIDDSGPGVADEKLGKVFEPFFTTKPTGQGTGLGMTVVKSIVDLHGGTIELSNRPEGGLRVTLVFRV